ncbi:MAG: hypothetical protein ACOC7R_05210 [Planctomycetota bacterium]
MPPPRVFETAERQLERVRDFWAGRGGRVIVSVTPGELRGGLQKADLDARFDAHAAHLPRLAELPGVNLPSVYPDFGTTSQALYWGCTPAGGADIAQPFATPAATTLDAAMELTPDPPDAPHRHAAQALALYHRLREHFATDRLYLRTPDAQGPLNTAGMILEQTELLTALIAAPEQADAFLHRVADWLVDLWRYLVDASGGRVCGSIWPHTFLPSDLGISFVEDLMPLLGADTYERFGIPLLRKIDRAFGGLHVHCCGRWGRHAAALAASGVNLVAAEFHYPYTRVEELAPLPERTVFVPYIALDQQSDFDDVASYYHGLLDDTPTARRYWFALVGDEPETLALARSLLDRA